MSPQPQRFYCTSGKDQTESTPTTVVLSWERRVARDERMQNNVSVNQIHWQFNLSRAPCWGGQFERMIGPVNLLSTRRSDMECYLGRNYKTIITIITVAIRNYKTIITVTMQAKILLWPKFIFRLITLFFSPCFRNSR